MKKPFVLIAAIVAVVGLGTAVAVAKETTKVRTSVSIRGAITSFHGRVKAKRGCEKQRTVTLHHRGEHPGELLRTDQSYNSGRYRIFPTQVSPVVDHRVVVHRKIIKKYGERIVCKRAQSRYAHIKD